MTPEHAQLLAYFERFISLTPEDQTLLAQSFKLTRIKKRQFLVQPDFVAKYRNYIVTGAVRAYVVADEGQEHTIAFSIDDWWITDYYSYIFQQPATMFVMAIEDSVLLQIDYETEQKLKKEHHKFETFFRTIAEKSFAHLQRRVISNLTQTAEERYDTFMQKYPKLAQRMPQYVLASYLGMTTEFLSKIRNKKTQQKS